MEDLKLTDEEQKLFEELHLRYKKAESRLYTQIKTKRQLEDIINKYSLRVHCFDLTLYFGHALESNEPIKRTALQIAEDINAALEGEFSYDDGKVHNEWNEFDILGTYSNITIRICIDYSGSDLCKYVEETVTQKVLLCVE